ncbi:serine hydrolase [Sphingomonas gilva]|uniref:serine hydrolase n=1 Tax=Sphingomonas gilva TaxID=2305907 RepID=UPI0026C5C386
MLLGSILARFGWGVPALAVAACVPAADAPIQRVAQAPAARVAAAAVPPAPPPQLYVPPPPRPSPALVETVRFLGREFEGRVGIAIRRVDTPGWSVDWQGDLPMPQQSVSKLWVAMTALDARDKGMLRLDQPVTVTRSDLTLFHQPIASLVKGDGYQTDPDELLRRAMTMSDNTANDKLLSLAGGPAAVNRFLAGKGLTGIKFGPGERLLQAKTAGLTWKQSYSLGRAFYTARANLPMATRRAAFDAYVANPPDGATANGIARALAKLHRGELLKPDSTAYLLRYMEESKTGRARLKGAMPPGWRLAHKTGTGQDLAGETAGFNDVGLITSPDGTTYAVAVLIGRTGKPVRDRQSLIQAVATTLIANHKP